MVSRNFSEKWYGEGGRGNFLINKIDIISYYWVNIKNNDDGYKTAVLRASRESRCETKRCLEFTIYVTLGSGNCVYGGAIYKASVFDIGIRGKGNKCYNGFFVSPRAINTHM